MEGREGWLVRLSLPDGGQDARSGQAVEARCVFKQGGDLSTAGWTLGSWSLNHPFPPH